MKRHLVRAGLALGLAVVAGPALLASPAQAQDWRYHGWHHGWHRGGWDHRWHRPPPPPPPPGYYGYAPPPVYAPSPPPVYGPPPGINVVIPFR